jgi:hypothetical protein
MVVNGNDPTHVRDVALAARERHRKLLLGLFVACRIKIVSFLQSTVTHLILNPIVNYLIHFLLPPANFCGKKCVMRREIKIVGLQIHLADARLAAAADYKYI